MSIFKRALVSAWDKTGILDLCRVLHRHGIEIVSTGGTASLLKENGIPVIKVSDCTGFPEILDGRVKTLHPKIHGAILADRSKEGHLSELSSHAITPIDIVVCNLYPFEKVTASPNVTVEEAVEHIDIGGVTLLRAAAKNFRNVVILYENNDFRILTDALEKGGNISEADRMSLAVKAFRRTSGYDEAINNYFSSIADREDRFPETLSLSFTKSQDLRYGENPHQKAALYIEQGDEGSSAAKAEQLHGKELSFNNYLDLDSAWNIANEFSQVSCAVMKHTNPSGCAVADTQLEALNKAWACDPLSAFGSVIGFNRTIGKETAEKLVENFVECVIAPGYSDEALELLKSKKNLRLLRAGNGKVSCRGFDIKRIREGVLVQGFDTIDLIEGDLKVVTVRQPTELEMESLRFAWKVAKNVKSNAIIYALKDRTIGVGAGQMSRVDSARIAVFKAKNFGHELKGCVMASDAFFPFRDAIDAAAEAGIAAIIEPGGSVKDQEVIDAANEHNIAMVFTGMRHFRH